MKRDKSDYEPLRQVVRILNKMRGEETIEKFAYGLGVNKSTLSRLLKGHNQDCRISTLAAICRKLDKKLVVRVE
jgi:DNA-binding Xre family transcriptional regulator